MAERCLAQVVKASLNQLAEPPSPPVKVGLEPKWLRNYYYYYYYYYYCIHSFSRIEFALVELAVPVRLVLSALARNRLTCGALHI